MDNLQEQLEFDLMADNYLNRADKPATIKNLHAIRELFQNDKDKLLNKVLDIDEVRKKRTRRENKNNDFTITALGADFLD